jgi:hypothetical protein
MSNSMSNKMNGGPAHFLKPELLTRVLTKLGLSGPIPVDLDGLRQVYAAWCTHVPFDNIRKMISLNEGPGATLAGLDPADFFENWLMNGSGGTCWPSSNALFTLLKSLGFDARRVAGSMFELPQVNHGTIKVTLDGEDWLVDSSMLTYEPFLLTDRVYVKEGPANHVEVEPEDGFHVVWADFPPMPEFIPCRLRLDPVDDAFYHERYESFSREESPFNQKLYFRRGGVDGAPVLFGNAKFTRTPDGFDIREFDRDGLCDYLVNEEGLSAELVAEWAASGALDSTFDPTAGGPPPEILRPRPSQR